MNKNAEKKPVPLMIAMLFVLLEGLVVAYFAAQLGIGILMGDSRSLVTAIALFALVAAAAAWVIFVAFSLLWGKRWARSGALFWQLIQLAVATGSFSGQFGSQAIGWSLILPSAVVLVALFNKQTIAATMKSSDPED